MFIALHSRVNPVDTWASRSKSGTGEQGWLRGPQFQFLHVDNCGQINLGLVPRGSPDTTMDSLGYDCPLCHPAMVLVLFTTPVPWDWSAEVQVSSTESNAESLSLSYPAGWNLFSQGAGFVPSSTETNILSYSSPHLSSPAPKSLGCTIYIHISHKSFIPWVASIAFSRFHWENASFKNFSQEEKCLARRQVCVFIFSSTRIPAASQSWSDTGGLQLRFPYSILEKVLGPQWL